MLIYLHGLYRYTLLLFVNCIRFLQLIKIVFIHQPATDQIYSGAEGTLALTDIFQKRITLSLSIFVAAQDVAEMC